jgi:hypothetical protein
MKRFIVAVSGLLIIVSLGAAASADRWLTGPRAPAPGTEGRQAKAPTPVSMPKPDLPKFDGNVASLDWGGSIERVGVVATPEDALDLIDGDLDTAWRPGNGQTDVVIGFHERDAVLIDRIVVASGTPQGLVAASRPIQVSISMSGPTDKDFGASSKAATLEPGQELAILMGQTQARYVRLRFTPVEPRAVKPLIREIRVMEGQGAGYAPLLARHAELTWMPPAAVVETGTADRTPTQGCLPRAATSAVRPGNGESRRVLAAGDSGEYVAVPLKKRALAPGMNRDVEVLTRVAIVSVQTRRLRPWMLAPASGLDYDTVAFEQVCDTQKRLAPVFKRALLDWVAAGHKLIIHDADICGRGPDYSFLPYPFKTSNPGKQGKRGSALIFVEDNVMAHGRPGQPGYIDVTAWLAQPNELGDSNTIVNSDPRWCGHMALRNTNGAFGFSEAYATYGRGLIIYNGFDRDDSQLTGYQTIVARELAQGFNPDNLPCSARLGRFVVKTESQLVDQPMRAGQTYVYPLSLLPNLGYKGRVSLSIASNPPVPGLRAQFEPAAVDVADMATSKLTVTVPPGAPESVALTVTGIDPAGTSTWACLFLSPARSGSLSITSTLAPPAKAGNNIEIILDGSGSMKTLMGKVSRWQTALGVLKEVVTQLPDGFNVGLRVYGHREPSTSPRTCTDSELVVPVRKLDRAGLIGAASAVTPRGETPLVYSVLQAPGDLKKAGGGTVILITDGEESCKGDAVKAAAELKASGVDLRLNIVGFALGAKTVQQDLTTFAQATSGRFYTAQSGSALAQALVVATIDRLPYRVYDTSGKQVAGGEAGDPALQLPPGEYRIAVKAGTQDLVADRVQVVLGRETKLQITLKDNQVVLQ